MKISDMKISRPAGNILFTLLLLVLSCEPCRSQDSTNIDWLQGYVSVKARGYAKKTGSPADMDNAIDAAKVVAQSELLEAIRGVHIDRQTAVGDLMEEKTETSIRVRGVLRNALLVGEPHVSENKGFVSATVEMRVCMYDNGTGCRSGNSLIDALPKHQTRKAGKKQGDVCSIVPNIADSQELLSKGSYRRSVPPDMIAVNAKGMPFNTGSRDFVVGFEASTGEKCSLYTPDMIDPAVRRDRGSAEIMLNEKIALDKYGSTMFSVKATNITADNFISLSRSDAYLLNIFNDNVKNALFLMAKFAVVIAD